MAIAKNEDAMNAAEATAIKSLIKKKRAALTKLKEQEAELRKLQAAVAAIPKVSADLAALERTLRMLNKEEEAEPEGQTQFPQIAKELGQNVVMRKDSIPSLVYSVLKEAGKPMKGDQIVPLIMAKGKKTNKLTIIGTIYRCAKKGQLFTLESPGVFGLLEWKEQTK